MMTKLYIIGKILTFPGAYIKGFWEQLTCRILGLPVEVPGLRPCGARFRKEGLRLLSYGDRPGLYEFHHWRAALYRGLP